MDLGGCDEQLLHFGFLLPQNLSNLQRNKLASKGRTVLLPVAQYCVEHRGLASDPAS